jgi:hypothetical protein
LAHDHHEPRIIAPLGAKAASVATAVFTEHALRLPSQAGHRTPWCRGYSSYIRHAFSVASQAKTSNPPLDVVTVTAGVVAFMALGPRPRVHHHYRS